MSADNGIYVTRWDDGFRYTYCTAVENIDYHPKGSPEWKRDQRIYFGHSEVYKSLETAVLKAAESLLKAQKAGIYVEYGVQIMDESRGEFPMEDE